MKTYSVVAIRTEIFKFTIEATSREAAQEIALQHCEEGDLIPLITTHADWQVTVTQEGKR